MRSILSRLAREKGHRIRVVGVVSAVEHMVNETAMHARTPASTRLAKANRASHGPRVRAKMRVKRTRANPKEIEGTNGAKGSRAKHRKPGTTVGIVTKGTMAGVLVNGVMSGVILDGTGVGNKRMTYPQAHFHLEVWILVPPVVRSGLNAWRICSEHIPVELWSTWNRRWKILSDCQW